MEATGREEQVSVRAVAREVGIAPQSFYLHFATVEELLWEVYVRTSAALAERLEAAARSSRAPRRRLEAVSLAYCRFALERPTAYRLMVAVTGQPDHESDSELPGVAAFQILQTSISACAPDLGARETVRIASLLWAGLHGLAGLRHDRPALAWAPLNRLVKDLIAALVPV